MLLRYITALIIILASGSIGINAMPPHPDLEKKLILNGRISEFVTRASAMQSKSGMNINRASPLSSGTMKIPVVLVQYSGTTFDAASTTAFYHDLLNGTTSSDLSVRRYYSDMSDSTLIMEFDIYGPYTVSENPAYYGSNVSGSDAHPGQLVNEAVSALIADQGAVDFSIYDNDNNGTVDAVVVIHYGQGEEVTGTSEQIWSHQWDLASANYYSDGDGPVITDGVAFNVYTMQPEYMFSAGDSTVGVFCHELGHVLGLPDLYDTSGVTNGVGNWSVMGTGSWGGTPTGSMPSPLLAWERYRIGGAGWVSLSEPGPYGVIDRDDSPGLLQVVILFISIFLVMASFLRTSPAVKTVSVLLSAVTLVAAVSCGDDSTSTRINGTLDDIEASHHAYRISLNDPQSEQYLFLEGKKTSAAGWYVPGTGILITHVHEGIISTYINTNAVNNGVSRVHGIDVIEASTSVEPGELWTNPAYKGSAADLFCAENNDRLTAATVPGSSYYTGSDISTKTGDSGVTIKNISSNAAFPVTFDVSVD
ncbi:MAG TPA: M6 family metalloprotease domain-containing protein [Spirochaetota bacterium]|nr:M6 family metalloprotease domain-containing protein [Spirochaetota bacterium]